VKSDNSEVGPEVEHLPNLELLVRDGVRLGLFHIDLYPHSSGN
jgi:hypothetical protein